MQTTAKRQGTETNRQAFTRQYRILLWGGVLLLSAGAVCTDTGKPSKTRSRLRLKLAPAAVEQAEPESTSQDGPGTHQQAAVIRPIDEGTTQQLASFCLTKAGQLVALVRLQPEVGVHGAAPIDSNAKPAAADAPPAEVRLLDADGKLLAKFPVDFAAQVINVGVDGNIIVAGDGVLARFDREGKQLARAEAPHLAAARQDPEAIERQARDAVLGQAQALTEALKQIEAQKKELDAKKEDELTDEERELKAQVDSTIAAYRQAIDQIGGTSEAAQKAQIEQMKQALLGQQRKINAIAAGPDHVFVTCAASKGFGYGVWRTDLDFANPVRIVDGLSGCCGQMDVQCCGAELVVAENSRHRVVRFDAEGKEIKAWGKRSRGGEGETFGGCCNPMNTRLLGDKLYVAESDGRVKLFSLDGEFLGLVGKANVQPGCKSSIVEVAPDGNTVYCFDVQQSSICVLKRQAPVGDQASK